MARKIAVIGAGSWGTALADLLAKKGHPVTIWSYEAEVADSINEERENDVYLPGFSLSPNLRATTDVSAAVRDAEVVLSVSPSQHVRATMAPAAGDIGSDAVIVSASKGIETTTLQTMDEVLGEVLPPPLGQRLVVISGPSFAVEVARELPTAVAVASSQPRLAAAVQELFQTSYFRVYTNQDVRGVELGGALKNIAALASGMAVGLGLGHNAQAALITRGLAEIARLGVALGADLLTFSGLSGMGDLVLTCTGGLSRNRSVGVALGEGRALEDILGEMKMVAEGVETTRAAYLLAQRTGIEMPIVSEVHAVLFEGRPAGEAVENLMLRDPKPEQWP